jgi:hypothetical protein
MKTLLLCFAFIAIAINAHAQSIVRGEYFIDTDPGYGHASPFEIALPADDVVQSLSIPYSAFPGAGHHLVYVRTRDAAGNWSLTGRRYVEADASSSSPGVIKVAYFFATDNGFGNNPFVRIDASTDGTWNFDIPFNQLPVTWLPDQKLFLRVQDSINGKWSLTTTIDSLNFTWVDIHELEQASGVAIYPNPFTDEISVTLSNTGTIRLALYTEDGKPVLEREVAGTTSINTQRLSPGMYIVLVSSGKKHVYRSTLIKQ